MRRGGGREGGVSGHRLGSAWTGRVSVCVCLSAFGSSRQSPVPAVNHHF